MNFITAVRSSGKAAAALLTFLTLLLPLQAIAQVAFQPGGSYVHNNRPWQITVGHFQNNPLLGIEMVTEWYDSGYRYSNSGSFYYISGAGAGYNGVAGQRGIAVADFDKNGTDDSVYVNAGGLTIRYHNLDKNAGVYAEGALLVAVADVNMDGYMDVVAVKPNGEILTFINNRIIPFTDSNGVFHSNLDGDYTKTDFPTEFIKPGAQAIATGLIDNNGRWGLAIANADGHVYVYLPYDDGSGSFYWSLVETKAVGINPASSNPTGIAIGDVDHDGTLDIVTANTGDSTISVLHGLGYGPFSNAVNYNTGIAPTCVAIADCNGDGVKDVFVGNSGENSISYYFGTGIAAAPLGTEHRYDTLGPVYAINTGDFNADNRLDLVYGAIDGSGVATAYGNGSGTFESPNQIDIFQGSVPVVGDLDGDGKPDVAAVNPSDGLTIYKNNGTSLDKIGQFFFPGLVSCDAGSLTLADLDNDGKKDIVGVGFYHSLVTVPNLGNMAFANARTFSTTIDAHRLAVADLNGDGYKDVILITPGEDRIELQYNDHFGNFSGSTLLAGAGDPWNIALGDLDGDGKLDIVITDRNNNRLTIWRGVGNSFVKIGTLAVANKPTAVQLADLNGDGKLDVIATALSPVNDDNDYNNDIYNDRVAVALGNGNGTFGAVSYYTVGRNPIWLQVADINFDGIPDIVTANNWSSNMSLLQGVGNGTFINSTELTELLYNVQGAGVFAIADMDGDSLPDFVVGATYRSSFGVYHNTTQTMTVTGTLQIQGRSAAGLQVTIEFRRNGSSEVFTRKATLNSSGGFTLTKVLAGNYTAHIKLPTGLAKNVPVSGGQGSTVNLGTIALLNGDANGDNAIDIGDLLVLINHYNQRRDIPANNPNYLDAADFNNDGVNDISDLLIIISNYNRRGDQ